MKYNRAWFREVNKLISLLIKDREDDYYYKADNSMKSPFLCDRATILFERDDHLYGQRTMKNWLNYCGSEHTGAYVFSNRDYENYGPKAQLERSMFLLFSKEFLQDLI